MRRGPAALLLTVCAAAVVWLVARRDDSAPAPGDEPPRAEPQARPPPQPAATTSGGLATTKPRPPRPEKPPRVSSTGEILDFGSIRVKLVPPEGTTVPDSLRLDVRAVSAALSAYPLPLREEDGTWLYESLPVGRYQVRGFVPGFQDGTVEAAVRRDQEVLATLELAAGSEAGFTAVLSTGGAPESVRVALLDGRGRPLAVSVQTDATTVHLEAAEKRSLPAKGKLVGLKPGRYKLRLTSPADESNEQEFEAKPGETPQIEIQLRR